MWATMSAVSPLPRRHFGGHFLGDELQNDAAAEVELLIGNGVR